MNLKLTQLCWLISQNGRGLGLRVDEHQESFHKIGLDHGLMSLSILRVSHQVKDTCEKQLFEFDVFIFGA